MTVKNRILVVNPGSTSTKIAVYEAEGQGAETRPLQEVFIQTLRHGAEELQSLGSVADQLVFRIQVVLDALKENGYMITDFNAIACRGGLVRQLPSGTYRVNEALMRDCRIGVSGQHASNLGALIGGELERASSVPAYVVDPPVVNELSDKARYSGHPLIERTCVWHALNQKAVARRYALSVGRAYEDMNLLVCHMGGGVSVGAHVKGRVLDTEDAVSGEGPFSPERAGSLPVDKVVDLCFAGDMTKEEIKQMLTRKSGLLAYTGTNNMQVLLKSASEGDVTVQKALEAFYYQVAKEIAAMSVAMKGEVDQIIFTGGIAHSQIVTDAIAQLVGWIAPVTVYPGEDEMQALAQGVLRVLTGEENAKDYSVTVY